VTARLFFVRLVFLVALDAKAPVVEKKDEEPLPVIDDALTLAA
jgi:hypothetical protein